MRLVPFAIALALLACGPPTQEPPKPAPTPTPAPVAAPAQAGSTEVKVDRRFELLAIVHRLAGAGEYRTSRTPYALEVDAAFAAFTDHPAVTTAKALRAKHGISYDAPMLLAAHLDDRFELRAADELPTIDARWTGVDVAAYAGQLRDFATASKLVAFFDAHQPYYTKVADTLRVAVDAERPVPWFDRFFGPRAKARFVVVPGLLSGQRNFGPRITLPDGREELFQVLGIHRPDGMPATDPQAMALLVHELAHSYVNPLLARHAAKLEPAGKQLFSLVEQPMTAQQYGRWPTVLDEAVVRAVTVMYLQATKGDAAAAAAIRDEVQRSFVWTRELVAALRAYERERPAGTPDPDALALAVAGFFDQLARSYQQSGLPKIPFFGPIDAAITAKPIFVSPAAAEPAAYVRSVVEQLFAGAPLVAATDRVFAESAGRHLVAFGSPATNPVVAMTLERAGWKLTPDAIVLGTKRFQGAGLVLVACRPRHDDPSRGVVIYAAANEQDLVGFNHGVRHGPTDWLVARRTAKRFEVLGSGSFPRGPDDAWLAP